MLMLSPSLWFALQFHCQMGNVNRGEQQQLVRHRSNNQQKTNKQHKRLLTCDIKEVFEAFDAPDESSAMVLVIFMVKSRENKRTKAKDESLIRKPCKHTITQGDAYLLSERGL